MRRATGVRPVLSDPSESRDEVGSWLPPRPEDQTGREPGGAALRGGVKGKGEAAPPIQVRLVPIFLFADMGDGLHESAAIFFSGMRCCGPWVCCAL